MFCMGYVQGTWVCKHIFANWLSAAAKHEAFDAKWLLARIARVPFDSIYGLAAVAVKPEIPQRWATSRSPKPLKTKSASHFKPEIETKQKHASSCEPLRLSLDVAAKTEYATEPAGGVGP